MRIADNRVGALIVLLLLSASPAFAEVLDKMGGCAGRDPWFAAAGGLALQVVFARAKPYVLAVSQVFTALFFFDSLFIYLGVVFGFGDPIWASFSQEVSSCERYARIGFWWTQAAAFLLWVAPLTIVVFRRRHK